MIELEKIYILTSKNPYNLGANQIIEILLVLQSAYGILKDQDLVMFYDNNYIDQNQFSKFYDSDQIKKL